MKFQKEDARREKKFSQCDALIGRRKQKALEKKKIKENVWKHTHTAIIFDIVHWHLSKFIYGFKHQLSQYHDLSKNRQNAHYTHIHTHKGEILPIHFSHIKIYHFKRIALMLFYLFLFVSAASASSLFHANNTVLFAHLYTPAQ